MTYDELIGMLNPTHSLTHLYTGKFSTMQKAIQRRYVSMERLFARPIWDVLGRSWSRLCLDSWMSWSHLDLRLNISCYSLHPFILW